MKWQTGAVMISLDSESKLKLRLLLMRAPFCRSQEQWLGVVDVARPRLRMRPVAGIPLLQRVACDGTCALKLPFSSAMIISIEQTIDVSSEMGLVGRNRWLSGRAI